MIGPNMIGAIGIVSNTYNILSTGKTLAERIHDLIRQSELTT